MADHFCIYIGEYRVNFPDNDTRQEYIEGERDFTVPELKDFYMAISTEEREMAREALRRRRMDYFRLKQAAAPPSIESA